MQKVAIITHYYKSTNCGGNLQAFALVKKISDLGFEAEQICFDTSSVQKDQSKVKNILRLLNAKRVIKQLKNRSIQKKISPRFQKIKRFNNQKIPHTEKVYNEKTVHECVNYFDAFVTGSDQVWNLKWYYPAYFLDFVPSNKIKISYAASVSMKELNAEQKALFKNHLKDYEAVSVREKSDTNIVADLSVQTVEWVLDPTMLLNKDEWSEIVSERIIDEPYVFCYFLGNDDNERKVASAFAKKKGLKLVTLPYLGSSYRKCDKKFGDIQLFDTGIEDFLSLIKNAEYVFTDSFHATVFSGIFEKQYAVFQRANHSGMESRIYTLCDLYETPERFCDTKEKASLEYVESLDNIDYERPLANLQEMKEKSINYLKKNLRKQ